MACSSDITYARAAASKRTFELGDVEAARRAFLHCGKYLGACQSLNSVAVVTTCLEAEAVAGEKELQDRAATLRRCSEAT